MALPLNTTTPEPSGSKSISPLPVDTISCPLTSNAPPSCGEVSSTTLDIPLPPPPPLMVTLVTLVILPTASTVNCGVVVALPYVPGVTDVLQI